jgi:hypothetical protein
MPPLRFDWIVENLRRVMPNATEAEIAHHASALVSAEVAAANERRAREQKIAEAERERIASIIQSEAGRADPVIASYFAFETDVLADVALRLLQVLRPETPNRERRGQRND